MTIVAKQNSLNSEANILRSGGLDETGLLCCFYEAVECNV